MAATLPAVPRGVPESLLPPAAAAAAAAPAGPAGRAASLEELSVRELKDLMWERGVSDAGCFEKADLVARLRTAAPEGAAAGEATATEGAGGSVGSMASAETSGAGVAAVDALEEHTPVKTSVASEWLGSPEHGPTAAPADVAAMPAGCAGVAGAGAARPAQAGKAPGVDWAALGRLLARRKRHRGVIKLYDPDKCFGFVACEDTKPIFHRDVYICRREFEEAEAMVGDVVSFALHLDGAGRPKANAVKVEEAGPVASPAAPRWSGLDPDAIYTGNVKSFHTETGFGFIACEETHKVFERDVFLHHSQRGGFEVGDRVQFRIQVDPVKGMPKAKDLKAAGPGEDEADLEEDDGGRCLPPAASPVPAAAKADVEKAAGAEEEEVPAARAEPDKPVADVDEAVPLCRVHALKGVCLLDSCRFRHTENEAQASARKQLRDVCAHHLANGCRWQGCEKRHPPEGEAEELRKLAQIVPCVFGRTCRTVNCLYTHPDGHSPICAAATVLAAQGVAKRRDGSAPPRLPSAGGAPPRPAVVRQLRASAAAAAGLPPPPLRPVPVFPDTLPQARAAAAEEKVATGQRSRDWAGLTSPSELAAGVGRAIAGGLKEATPAADAPQASGRAAEAGEEVKSDSKAPVEAAAAATGAPAAGAGAGGEGVEAAAEATGARAAGAGAGGEGAEAALPATAPASGDAGAGPGPWTKYAAEDGSAWWWCEQDGDWLVEATPEPWVKYVDPNSGRHYWWKDENKWFWT